MQGSDASNLLDETPFMKTEKTTPPNNNFAKGFEIIDEIKAVVDKKCGRPIVSCADILAVAARDTIGLPHFLFTAALISSIISNPLAELLFGGVVFSIFINVVSSNKLEASHPCMHAFQNTIRQMNEI